MSSDKEKHATSSNGEFGNFYDAMYEAFKFVSAIAWSPDGHLLASSNNDKSIQIWEVATGNHVLTLNGHTDHVKSLAWSPDGRHIASASDIGTMQIWEATTGNNIRSYLGRVHVKSLAWSPDGKRIVFGGEECIAGCGCEEFGIWIPKNEQTIRILDVETGNEMPYQLLYNGEQRVSYKASLTLAFGFFFYVPLLKICYGIHNQSKGVTTIVWSPDGSHIALGRDDATVQVWNSATGDHIITYSGHSDVVTGVTWSRDGTYIASSSYDKTVHIWNFATGNRILAYCAHTGEVDVVEWSPDGSHIASGSSDGELHVWNAATGTIVFFTYYSNSGEVRARMHSADGRNFISANGINVFNYCSQSKIENVNESEKESRNSFDFFRDNIEYDETDEEDWMERYDETDTEDVMADGYDKYYNQYYERDLGDEAEEYLDKLEDLEANEDYFTGEYDDITP